MSRSYKKVAIFKIPNDSEFKSIFNRKLRRTKEYIGNGGRYKKFNSSYDICDFKCPYFNKQDLDRYERLWGKSYKAWIK